MERVSRMSKNSGRTIIRFDVLEFRLKFKTGQNSELTNWTFDVPTVASLPSYITADSR